MKIRLVEIKLVQEYECENPHTLIRVASPKPVMVPALVEGEERFVEIPIDTREFKQVQYGFGGLLCDVWCHVDERLEGDFILEMVRQETAVLIDTVRRDAIKIMELTARLDNAHCKGGLDVEGLSMFLREKLFREVDGSSEELEHDIAFTIREWLAKGESHERVG